MSYPLQKLQMRKLQLIRPFTLVLVVALMLPACTNEDLTPILGCTDTTALNFDTNATNNDGTCAFASKKIIGEWRASLWQLKGTDFVCSDFKVNYDFQEDGFFEYTFTGNVLTSFTGHGQWGLVGNELRLDYGGKGLNWKLASAFYDIEESSEENFTTQFEEDFNHLSLGISLGGVSLDILFDKKRERPIDKDNF